MRILGLDISRSKSVVTAQAVSDRGWRRIVEPFAGAWQRGIEICREDVSAFPAVFACRTQIASDIGKLRPRLLRQKGNIWVEDRHQTLTPLLRKPNQFQTMQQFITDWVTSLMRAGNTYVLIERTGGNVNSLVVMNPEGVTPLVTPSGDVYYRLRPDNLAGVTEELVVPAAEVIHQRINTLYHPLVGLSPLYAAGLAAQAGVNISKHSAGFFGSMARPGGVLTAPGEISDSTAKRLKEYWEENFVGSSAGRIAVLGDDLKFQPMTMTAADAQMIEQQRFTAEQVAMAFRVPAFMIGAAPVPAVANAELLMQQYYKSCLQAIIEGFESSLDAGLALADDIAVELDVEGGLLRLDTAARFASYEVAMRSGWMSPNEARQKENLPPVTGGDSPMIQMQNYSLAALAKRDSSADPFASAPATGKASKPRVREWNGTTIFRRDDLALYKGMIWRALRDDTMVWQPGGAHEQCELAWAPAKLSDQRIEPAVEVIRASDNGSATEVLRQLSVLAERIDLANEEGSRFADAITLRLEMLTLRQSGERDAPRLRLNFAGYEYYWSSAYAKGDLLHIEENSAVYVCTKNVSPRSGPGMDMEIHWSFLGAMTTEQVARLLAESAA